MAGRMSNTNYDRYFGSPERVALTFATIREWETGKPNPRPTVYGEFGACVQVDFKSATAILNWLYEKEGKDDEEL